LKEPFRYASICYGIDIDGKILIDVEMEDYSPETIDKFSTLFASVPSTPVQVEAISILQTAFDIDDRGLEFEEFAKGAMLKSAMLVQEEEGLKLDSYTTDPLIKPTDLL